jgi:hypothetical protein
VPAHTLGVVLVVALSANALALSKRRIHTRRCAIKP